MTTTATDKGTLMTRHRARSMLIGAALVALTGACSGGGSGPSAFSASSSSSSTTRPASPVTAAGGGGGNRSGPTSVGGIDLSKTPPLGASGYVVSTSTGRNVVSFRNGAATPKVVDLGLSPAERNDSQYTVSPSGRYVAVARTGDAIGKPELAIIDVTNGRTVDSEKLDAQSISNPTWSPDEKAVVVFGTATNGSRAGYLHKINGATASGRATPQSYAFETRGDEVIFASTQADRLAAGDSSQSDEVLDVNARVFQGEAEDGAPLILLSRSSGITIGDGTQPQVFATPDSSTNYPTAVIAQACGRIALMTQPGGANRYYLDTATGALYPAPAGSAPCPIVAPDGTAMAYGLTGQYGEQGVKVQSLDAGSTTAPVPVAREGQPLAWSADSSRLLVQGTGTFLVKADGTGGGKTSLQLQPQTAVCPDELDGQWIVFQRTTGSVYLLDTKTGKASDIGDGPPGETCTVSKDGNWIVSGSTLVDLRHRKAGYVRDAMAQYGSYQRIWFLPTSSDQPLTRVTVR